MRDGPHPCLFLGPWQRPASLATAQVFSVSVFHVEFPDRSQDPRCLAMSNPGSAAVGLAM